MPLPGKVTEHYQHGRLLEAISSAFSEMGKTEGNISIDDLAAVDEFHIGGQQASKAFLDQLRICEGQHFLDIGCGPGGTARFVADRYHCYVTGIDLSEEYIEIAKALCKWVRLEQRIRLQQENALSTSFAAESFDGAYMLHVAMNIEDKSALAGEIYRVLKPGALYGIYDVMRMDKGELDFPLPWAGSVETSAVASSDEYKTALEQAGFNIVAERNRRDFALQFFLDLKNKTAAAKKRPALGLHILMGETAPLKIKNLIANISSGKIAPVEIIAQKKQQ